MMYHFIFGLRGASALGVATAPSPLGGCSPPAPASFFSSSCMIKFNSAISALTLVPEIAVQISDALLQKAVDNEKEQAKQKYRNHDYDGGRLHVLPRGRGDF